MMRANFFHSSLSVLAAIVVSVAAGTTSLASSTACLDESIELLLDGPPLDRESFPATFDKLQRENLFFTHKRYPGSKFRVRIQEDYITPGLLSGDSAGKFMAFIELLPESPSGKPHVLALVTDIYQQLDGSLHFGWLSNFSYREIFQRVAEVKANRNLPTYFGALGLGTLEAGGHFGPQMKFLTRYLAERFGTPAPGLAARRFGVKHMADEEFLEYFSDQSIEAERPGIAFAIVELFSKRATSIGTRVSLEIANKETLAALKEGRAWRDTFLGRYAEKAGFAAEKLEFGQPGSTELPRVILKKVGDGSERFEWMSE